MDPILLKPSQVAQLLGLGRSKVYDLLSKQEIPSIKIGKAVRVPAEALRAWVNERMADEGATDSDAPVR